MSCMRRMAVKTIATLEFRLAACRWGETRAIRWVRFRLFRFRWKWLLRLGVMSPKRYDTTCTDATCHKCRSGNPCH